jgi:Putative phage abortive infection protein
MVNAIFIARRFRQVNPETAGQLGAFIGGYVGAIFAPTGVVLLYSTLRNQVSAFRIQSFETKYFELIKIHRDNVAGIELRGESGRKVFVSLMRELRCALEIVQIIAQRDGYEITRHGQLQIAYYCLFFGVGTNSSRMLKTFSSNLDLAFVEEVEGALNNPRTKEEVRKEQGFQYAPFEGHQSRLGHYYRHLYQMTRYVDQQKLNIDKYEYPFNVESGALKGANELFCSKPGEPCHTAIR